MKSLCAAFFLVIFSCVSAAAQTTEFTYQGSLKNTGVAANGNFDFEFALFDSLSGGGQLGSTSVVNNVVVTNGIFSVKLDFGNQFTGAARFLEIRVRLAGQPGITTLAPRQLMNSAPYSVKAINSDDTGQLGGVAANQYVVTTDPRMTDARPPTAGSVSYIQNGTSEQPSSSFNISGNGLIGGNVGIGAGTPQKKLHVFGQDIRVEASNAVTPRFSIVNTAGIGFNTAKWQNYATSVLSGPSFGVLNFTALNDAENQETAWLQVQRIAGTAIDSVTFPNGYVLVNNRLAANQLLVGTTNTNLIQNGALDVRGTANISDSGNSGLRVQTNTAGGTVASFGGNGAFNIDSPGTNGGRLKVLENGNVGIGLPAGANVNNKLDVNGTIAVWALGFPGTTPICWNSGTFQISTCSSSLKYKTNILQFSQGMSFVNKLRPISFDWKDGGMKDVGFGAEDVEKIDPRFVTYNSSGEVEGVKYDRIGVVLVNAIKEQQAQIEKQQALIEQLEKRLEQLEKKDGR